MSRKAERTRETWPVLFAAPLAFVGFGLLGWMPFGPAEQAKSDERKRCCDGVLAAQREEPGEAQHRSPGRGLGHRGEFAWIGLQIFLRHPEQDGERGEPEQQGHCYLICASSFCAPALRFADRSASALTPPAAYTAAARSSSASSCAADRSKRQ